MLRTVQRPFFIPALFGPIMAQRIYEQYHPGEQVEITFQSGPDKRWLPAVVLRPDPPGVWVATADGRHWFMTNTFRIRRAGEDAASS